MSKELRIVCSWCDLVVQEGPHEHTSNTMCERCTTMTEEEIDLQIDYLQARKRQENPEPVFICEW